jgi:hypothetical protein
MSDGFEDIRYTVVATCYYCKKEFQDIVDPEMDVNEGPPCCGSCNEAPQELQQQAVEDLWAPSEEIKEWARLLVVRRGFVDAVRLGELSTKMYKRVSTNSAPAQEFDRVIKQLADAVFGLNKE